MMNHEMRNLIREADLTNAILLDNPSFDNSIIGISTSNQVIYDLNSMVLELANDDNISNEEALEFIEYNTLKTLLYIDIENRPIILNSFLVES